MVRDTSIGLSEQEIEILPPWLASRLKASYAGEMTPELATFEITQVEDIEIHPHSFNEGCRVAWDCVVCDPPWDPQP